MGSYEDLYPEERADFLSYAYDVFGFDEATASDEEMAMAYRAWFKDMLKSEITYKFPPEASSFYF